LSNFLATQPKKFYPLDCFIPEDYYLLDSFTFIVIHKDPIALALAVTVPSPISGMNEESKLAQHEDMTGSYFGHHFSSCMLLLYSSLPVNLPGTIYLESPCPSAPSSIIKAYQDDVNSNDCDLLLPNLSTASSTKAVHVIPSCSAAVPLDVEFTMENGSTKVGDFPRHSQLPLPACFMDSNAFNKLPGAPGWIASAITPKVYIPTHTDPALSALAMVVSFDAQALAAEENPEVTKPIMMYKESVYITVPTSAPLTI